MAYSKALYQNLPGILSKNKKIAVRIAGITLYVRKTTFVMLAPCNNVRLFPYKNANLDIHGETCWVRNKAEYL
jgi:hypothetical protein